MAAFHAILRYDEVTVAILAPLSFVPMVSAWAVIAMFDPEPVWYRSYVTFFASLGPVSTICGAIIAAFALQAMIVSMVMRLVRRRVLQWVALGLSAGVSLGYQLLLADYEKGTRPGIARIESEGNKVIVAIERFRNQYGRSPSRLDELTPAFFAETPGPGLVGYREFDYVTGMQGYTISLPLQTWPGPWKQIVYRSHPPDFARLDSVQYGKWIVEQDRSRTASTPKR
jgi:hypothetical protein